MKLLRVFMRALLVVTDVQLGSKVSFPLERNRIFTDSVSSYKP